MALIIEDGSIVQNANSYVTLAEARDFALNYNVTLTTDDSALTALLVQAKDYLQTIDFKGLYVDSEQELSFPREYLYINDKEIDSQSIPKKIKQAQIMLAMIASEGVDLLSTVSGQKVVKEKLGDLEVQYSDKDSIGSTQEPIFMQLKSFIGHYVENTSIYYVADKSTNHSDNFVYRI